MREDELIDLLRGRDTTAGLLEAMQLARRRGGDVALFELLLLVLDGSRSWMRPRLVKALLAPSCPLPEADAARLVEHVEAQTYDGVFTVMLSVLRRNGASAQLREAIEGRLENKDRKVRRAGFQALMEEGSPFSAAEAVALVHERFAPESDRSVFEVMWTVLRVHGTPLQVCEAIEQVLEKERGAARREALWALAEGGGPLLAAEAVALIHERLASERDPRASAPMLLVLRRHSTPAQAREVTERVLEDTDDWTRQGVFAALAEANCPFWAAEAVALVHERIASERYGSVFRAMVTVLQVHGTSAQVREAIEGGLGAESCSVREAALEALAEAGSPFSAPEAVGLLLEYVASDPFDKCFLEDVAFDGISKVLHQHGRRTQVREAIELGLKNEDWKVRDAAVDALAQENSPFSAAEAVALFVERIESESDPVVFMAMLSVLRRHGTPAQLREAIERGLKNQGWMVRRAAVDALAEESSPFSAAEAAAWVVERIASEADEYVVAGMLSVLRVRGTPAQVRDAFAYGLRHSDPRFRRSGVNALSGGSQRTEAVSWVDGELAQALGDQDTDGVREATESALADWTDAARVADVRALRARADALRDWGTRLGRVLWPRREVQVVRLLDGLGQTVLTRQRRDRHAPVVVEVSEDPVTHGARAGDDVMRGLIVHELGHHLYDNLHLPGVLNVRGQVRSEGLELVFAILQDERLERRLRVRGAAYQVWIDRMNRHAFAERTLQVSLAAYAGVLGVTEEALREALVKGDRPGRFVPRSGPAHEAVELSAADCMQIPGLMAVGHAFLLCLVGGFDPRLYYDGRMQQAIAAVPGNLKDLDHGGLLKVARSARVWLDAIDRDWGRKPGAAAQVGAPDAAQPCTSAQGSGACPHAYEAGRAQALAPALDALFQSLERLGVISSTMQVRDSPLPDHEFPLDSALQDTAGDAADGVTGVGRAAPEPGG